MASLERGASSERGGNNWSLDILFIDYLGDVTILYQADLFIWLVCNFKVHVPELNPSK